MHGGEASIFVADRLGALALANDRAGISTWQEIAERLQHLIQAEGRVN
jgi:hypothetical protein